MCKKFWMPTAALALILIPGKCLNAQTLTITFSTATSGITLSGSGTSSATLGFGNVQALGGTVPSGVTKSLNGAINWSLSTPVDVLVTKSGVTSASYALTAQLQSVDSTHTWNFGSATLNSSSPATVTLAGSYATATPYTLTLTIPFSASAGSISNSLDFIATAN